MSGYNVTQVNKLPPWLRAGRKVSRGLFFLALW